MPKSSIDNLKPQSFSSLNPQQRKAHALTTQVNDPDRVALINEEADGWVAGNSKFFTNWTLANTTILTQADWRFGPLELAPHYDPDSLSALEIPSSFDARTQWKECSGLTTIRNQGPCGSCWAFAAIESLADRYCIADSSKYGKIELSAQYVMGCDRVGHGCDGGYIDEVWGFLQSQGTTTET